MSLAGHRHDSMPGHGPNLTGLVMEYTIQLSRAPVDVDRVRDALEDIDPAAIVDLDPRGQGLRVWANMLDRELYAAFERAGHPPDSIQVTRLPSVCCGSCSG